MLLFRGSHLLKGSFNEYNEEKCVLSETLYLFLDWSAFLCEIQNV